MEILVLGTENVGKTLLVKSVREWLGQGSLEKMSYEGVTPTVGVNIVDLTLPATTSSQIIDQTTANHGQQEALNFKIRELGSAIALKWFTYFDQCDAVVFLVDISDVSTWATSMVLLHETYTFLHATHNQRKKLDGDYVSKPMLLVLTKTDITDQFTISAGKDMLGINQLLHAQESTGNDPVKLNNRPPKLSLLQGSCYEESLVKQVVDWIASTLRDG